MKTMLAIAGAALLALPGIGLVTADHGCNGDVLAVGAVYYDQRADGVWLYLETNGEEGLQSGGLSPAGAAGLGGPLNYNDSCAHANPDMMIF